MVLLMKKSTEVDKNLKKMGTKVQFAECQESFVV
jgi:hypothetical protein